MRLFAFIFIMLSVVGPSVALGQIRPQDGHPLPSPEQVESQAPDSEPNSTEQADPEPAEAAPEPPKKLRRLYRIGALSLTAWAALTAGAGMALGMDVALFGQEFHDQARTFSMLNALLGTISAAGMVWPLGLALDGNGSFWATTLSALVAGGAGIGVMYAWAHGDPDRLLAQSFTPGVLAFTTAIVTYEMTSDTSRRYRDKTGLGDRWITVAPKADGAIVGIAGRF